MRTEEDLRDALATLERHAPRTARVLPAGRRGHRLRLSRGPRWLAGVTTATALAGVITVLAVPGAAPAHIPNGRVASLQPPAPATLRAKLLAAFSAASGQIVYEHSTWATTGGETSVMDGWYYPWQARKGQLVRSRRLVLNADGTPYQDVEFVYQMPSPGSVPAGLPSAQRAKIGRLTGVVAAMGEIIDVEYGNRTWSDQKDHLLLDSDPGAPVAISARVAAGHWKVVGDTALGGHRAIELAWSDGPGSGSRLWVDAGTYLPLREEAVFPVGGPGNWATTTVRDDYELLPATPASLAKLTPPVPAGFRRTARQVVPENGPGAG